MSYYYPTGTAMPPTQSDKVGIYSAYPQSGGLPGLKPSCFNDHKCILHYIIFDEKTWRGIAVRLALFDLL